MSNSIFSKFFSRARTTDPVTSHAAAYSIRDSAERHMKLIHEALEMNGPMGKDGIAYACGLDPNQVSRRLPEMAKIGMVKLTGQTVESLSGRKEREWTHL